MIKGLKICGISDLEILKYILKTEKPWGVILFKRNIKSYDQLRNLTKNIRQCIKDPFYPIFIDEEGEKVSRLKNIINL